LITNDLHAATTTLANIFECEQRHPGAVADAWLAVVKGSFATPVGPPDSWGMREKQCPAQDQARGSITCSLNRLHRAEFRSMMGIAGFLGTVQDDLLLSLIDPALRTVEPNGNRPNDRDCERGPAQAPSASPQVNHTDPEDGQEIE